MTIEFSNKLKNNNNFYSKILINEYLELFNLELISNNIHNISIDVVFDEDINNLDLFFVANQKDPIVINKIDITGNSITKNKTIRSKLSIEPVI